MFLLIMFGAVKYLDLFQSNTDDFDLASGYSAFTTFYCYDVFWGNFYSSRHLYIRIYN